jgi:GT2 family glycosyltransferase
VAISPHGRVQYRGRGQAHDAPEFGRPAEVQCLISAAWLMRRAVCEQIGGLDEAFNPAQFEDFDFCYRARQAGWRIKYEPSVEMYHFENVTTGRTESLNYKYLTVKNGMRFKNKWQRRFSREGGRPDSERPWRTDLPTCKLEDIGELETVA